MNWCTVKIPIWLTLFEVQHACVAMNLRVTFSNDLLSKLDIRFVHSKSIKLSGKNSDDWDLVVFSLKGDVVPYY